VGALLTVLAWLILAVLAVGSVLLATPTVFLIEARAGAAPRYRIGARILGGLAPEILLVRSDRDRPPKSPPAEPEPKPPAPKPKTKAKRRRRRGGPDWRRVFTALPRLLAELLGTVHIERLTLAAEFGTGDPAETGQIYGAATPFLHAVPWTETVEIDLTPNFTDRVLAGRCAARLRFTPVSVLPPALRFAWRAFGPER